MNTAIVVSQCFACGAGPAAPRLCPSCTWPTTPPHVESEPLVGDFVEHRHGPNRLRSLVIEQRGPHVTVVTQAGELFAVDRSQLVTGPVDEASAIASPECRVLATLHGDTTSASNVARAAVHTRVISSADRLRAFARSAVELDREAWLEGLHLSPTEVAWLIACRARSREDEQALLSALALLPVDRYPVKLSYLAWLVSRGVLDRPLRGGWLDHVRPFLSSHPLAPLLAYGVDDPTTLATRLEALASVRTLPIDVGVPGYRELIRALAQPRQTPGVDLSTVDEHARSIAVLWASRGAPFPARPNLDLDVPAAALIDDLIDRGRADAVPNELLAGLLPADASRARLRLGRGGLDTDGLPEPLRSAELARQAFLEHRTEPLEALDAKVAEVLRYQLLARLRDGDATILADLLPLLPPDDVETAAQLGRAIEGGPTGAAVVADHSTWPTLLEVTGRSGRDVRELDGASGELSGWWSLSEAHRALFDWRFEDAAEHIQRCLGVSRSEPIRDEALNLRAFLRLREDDLPRALDDLEEALAGVHTAALQENGAIIASALGGARALEHLASLAAHAPTLELRVRAARSALEIVHAEGAEVLPHRLRNALRQLVLLDLDLVFLGEIALRLSELDAEWFGDETNLRRAHHRASPELRIHGALARDWAAYIEELAHHADDRTAPDWTRERLRAEALQVLSEMAATTGFTLEFGFAGLHLVDYGTSLPQELRLGLEVWSLRELCCSTANDAELADPVVARLKRLHREVPALSTDDDELAAVLEQASIGAAVRFLQNRAETISGLVDECNEMVNLGSNLATWLRQAEARLHVDELYRYASEGLKATEDYLTLVSGAEIRGHLTDLRDTLREAERYLWEVRS